MKKETLEAIQADDFAMKAIEGARMLIYSEHRDWARISRNGKLLFDDDDAATAYLALCALLGKDPRDTPDVGEMKVRLGNGSTLPAYAVDMLQAAIAAK